MECELLFRKNHFPDTANPILFYMDALKTSAHLVYKASKLEGTDNLAFAKPFLLKDAGDHILKCIEENKPFVSIYENKFNSCYYRYNDKEFFNNTYEFSFIALNRGSRMYQDLRNTEICEDEAFFL